MTIAHIVDGELGFDVRSKLNDVIDIANAAGGGMAIGGTITSATLGSVLFAGPAGVLAQDNANFFWDDTNNALKIGGTNAIFKKAAATNNWFLAGAGNFTLTNQGNLAIGGSALGLLTSGAFNMGFGSLTLERLTTGSFNVAVGTSALQFNTTGNDNVAIGTNALGDHTPSNSCVGIGSQALSGYMDIGSVGIGFEAGGWIQSGPYNVNIGYRSAWFVGDGSGKNTWVGGYVGPGRSTAVSNTIVLADGAGAASLDNNVDCGLDYNLNTSHVWSFQDITSKVGLHVYNVSEASFPIVNYERAVFDWNVTANVLTIGTQKGGSGVKRLTAIDGFTKAGAPAASDLPANSFAVIDDTSAGQTWLVFNKAGVIRKVQLT